MVSKKCCYADELCQVVSFIHVEERGREELDRGRSTRKTDTKDSPSVSRDYRDSNTLETRWRWWEQDEQCRRKRRWSVEPHSLIRKAEEDLHLASSSLLAAENKQEDDDLR